MRDPVAERFSVARRTTVEWRKVWKTEKQAVTRRLRRAFRPTAVEMERSEILYLRLVPGLFLVSVAGRRGGGEEEPTEWTKSIRAVGTPVDPTCGRNRRRIEIHNCEITLATRATTSVMRYVVFERRRNDEGSEGIKRESDKMRGAYSYPRISTSSSVLSFRSFSRG